MTKTRIAKIVRKQGTNWNILGYRALMIMTINDVVKNTTNRELLKKEVINFHRNIEGFEKNVMIMKFIECDEKTFLEIKMEDL